MEKKNKKIVAIVIIGVVAALIIVVSTIIMTAGSLFLVDKSLDEGMQRIKEAATQEITTGEAVTESVEESTELS